MMRFTKTAVGFSRDEAGQFGVLAAVSAVPIVIGLAALANYSNMITVKRETQAAADAAALAATTAFATGKVTTVSAAQQVAAQYFAANAPASAVANQVSFTAVVTPPAPGSSTVSATVNYCGDVPAIVSATGSLSQVCAAAAAKANVTAAQSGAGTYSAFGESWGDPHMIGADGYDFYYGCNIGKWTNVMSDYGLQINGLCQTWYGGAQVFSDVTMVVGGHYIYVTSGYNNYNNGDFEGVVTVDGLKFTPTAAGVYKPLTDAAQNIVLTDYYGQPNVPNSYANYLVLTTPEYIVTIYYGNWDTATVAVQTNNAGVCGVPGGVLGQTWGSASNVDTNGLDFQVPGGSNYWYLASQYSQSCDNVSANTQTKPASLTK